MILARKSNLKEPMPNEKNPNFKVKSTAKSDQCGLSSKTCEQPGLFSVTQNHDTAFLYIPVKLHIN